MIALFLFTLTAQADPRIWQVSELPLEPVSVVQLEDLPFEMPELVIHAHPPKPKRVRCKLETDDTLSQILKSYFQTLDRQAHHGITSEEAAQAAETLRIYLGDK